MELEPEFFCEKCDNPLYPGELDFICDDYYAEGHATREEWRVDD